MQGWPQAGLLLPSGIPSLEHEAGQGKLPGSGLLPLPPPCAAHPEQDHELPAWRPTQLNRLQLLAETQSQGRRRMCWHWYGETQIHEREGLSQQPSSSQQLDYLAGPRKVLPGLDPILGRQWAEAGP